MAAQNNNRSKNNRPESKPRRLNLRKSNRTLLEDSDFGEFFDTKLGGTINYGYDFLRVTHSGREGSEIYVLELNIQGLDPSLCWAF